MARFDGVPFRVFDPWNTKEPHSERVSALCEDAGGDSWIGTKGGGVTRYREGEFRLRPVAASVAPGAVHALCEDGNGGMWLGTTAGLVRLDGRGSQVLTTRDGLPSDQVLAIVRDRAGNLWVGTNGGLNRWAAGALMGWDTRDGLANAIVTALLEDAAGDLWTGTQQGLNRFAQGRLDPCPPAEGWPPGSVWAFHEDAEGTLWLGTADGLYERREGRITLLCLREDSDGVLWCGTLGGGLIRLQAGTATAFTVREGLRDSTIYQILDDGTGWLWLTCNRGVFKVSRTELERLARRELRRLTPRVYDRTDGLPSQECTGFAQPAGWRSADGRFWFPTRRGVAVLDPARLRLAQDLHDNLGASLTEIALMSDPEHPELTELGRARSHVGRIALKARLMVQTLNEIVWAVNPRNDNLPRLLDYLCTFSEELCEAAGGRCWHEVPVGLPARPLKVEFRHHLLLAVKEALQNVLKHAHATEVWLRVSVAGDQLEVVLRDNGRGFPPGAPPPRGCGLENMRTRLEQIGGWTEVLDAGQGTTVRFIAPLGGGRLRRPRTEAGPAGRGN